ncbi:glycosyltransferase [Bacillus thuringiensis]|uniref:glycosyltransferase n=1 Tax=Bacillus thuringiensis TaxID=1428 RepID=UPI000BF660BC|nr:nucleotide disphospho-sugar-binding domain-containing protein [Bacillus thuringiensis]PEZ26493.1 glycosyltransferase [Bacillus thuringiensis]
MAKFLISTMPATGHVNPILTTATKLVEEGHQVVWHSGPAMEGKIKATGASFVPFKHTPDIIESAIDKQEKGLAAANTAVTSLFVDPMLGQMKDYQEIIKEFPADVLIVDMCSLGAYLFHEKGGPVWASVGMIPLRTGESAMHGSGKPPAKSALGRLNNRMINWIGTNVMLKDVTKKMINDLRSIQGPEIPKGKTAFDCLMSPFLHLHGTTAAFEFPYKEIPSQLHYVGPMLPPMPTDFILPKWWSELSSGKPVVHVTQGTVATDVEELTLPTIRAMADENVLVVVTTPNPEKLGDVPRNVRVERMIPHSLLLPYVDVMVTNGGYNGVKVALSHGVPLVAAGILSDQPEVCGRIEYFGAGVNLKTSTPSSSQLKEAILKVLKEPAYRREAKVIQSDFASYDSATEVVRLLELLAKTKKAVLRERL